MVEAWPAGFREVRHRRTNGPDLALRVGPANGAPVLLLPGLGDPAESYAAILPVLAGSHHVHLLDYRGHAPSGPDPRKRYRVRDHLGDVLDVLAAMPGPALICGNSLGAVLAVGAAAADTERVRGVVLEDGPLFLIEGDAWRASPIRSPSFARIAALLRAHASGKLDGESYVAAYRRRPWAFGGSGGHPGRVRHVAALMRLLGDGWPALPDDERTRLQRGHGRFLSEGRATWGDMLPDAIVTDSARRWAAMDWRAMAAAARPDFSAGLDHATALAALRCPVLVLEADRDLVGLLPPATMERLLAALGSGVAEHRLVTGALHEIHSSAPAAWLDAVGSFAGRLDGKAA